MEYRYNKGDFMKNISKFIYAILFCILGFLFFTTTKVYGASTDYALKFSSDGNFTLKANSGKTWDGTIEYSLNNGSTWVTWDGSELLGTATQPIYLRGTGNTVITGNNFANKWVMTGSNVECHGNIENLLDYQTVANGEHPTMGAYCYMSMFDRCESLATAPELPATMLTERCYRGMFTHCTSLTTVPKLPATTLADWCYDNMFYECTSLETAPELPATTLADFCYGGMFYGCTSLATAPELPATTLAANCYNSMFRGCTSLTTAPNLPAMTLADSCYGGMFFGCTSLETAPALPATTLAEYCYNLMFEECTSLEQASELPATTLATRCYNNMFGGCTSLVTAPALPATMLTDGCYYGMFKGCTSLEQAPDLPAITLANRCYYGMFENCSKLKLSETQEEGYPYEYNLGDLSYDDTECSQAPYTDMFIGTGGVFKGTPEPNKTYYVNFKTVSATQTVEIPTDLPKIEKKDNIPTTSLDDRDKKSACEVIANVYYAYYVSMPATLTLSPSEETDVYVSDYKVKAKTKAEGLAGKYIKVSPEHSIDLTNENNGNTVTLTIEQDKEYFGENNSSNVVKVSADKWVETKGRVKSIITEQGNYKGNFKFEYGLVDSIE